MARPSSAGTIPAIFCDLNDRWRNGALCLGEAGCGCPTGKAWTIMPNESFKIGTSKYTGEELIGLALQVCERCPVQWDCAEYAITTEQRWGTWAMHPHDLSSIVNKQAGLDLVGRARRSGVPVQIAVSRAQRSHLIA